MGSLIWRIFKALSAVIMAFTSKISPSFNFAFWTITVLSSINGIWAIYNSWILEIAYSRKVLFGVIIFNILVIELTFALIQGSSSTEDTYYE